jgi:3-phenylpropionate/trans-cinnamate dioxygenase ferredoxin subunit
VSWRRVAALADLGDDAPLAVTLDDTPIALCRVAGAVHAVSDLCTHEYVRLSGGTLDGGVIECPLHRARFDVVTGRCLARPAEADLDVYPVRVADGAIWIRLDGPGSAPSSSASRRSAS